jgi:hypothetical protein
MLLLLAAVACGDDSSTVAAQSPPAPAVPDDELWALSTMVLESSQHGPKICPISLDSYPPQCGGPIDLAGWSWDLVDDEERANDTIWAGANLVGSWDGTTFTVERADGPEIPYDDGGEDFVTACEEPEGDPDASRGDQSIPGGEVRSQIITGYVSDGESVLNLVVLPGSRDEVIAAARQRYQGLLCVVERDGPSYAELNQLYEEIAALPPTTTLGRVNMVALDDAHFEVDVELVAATEEARAYAAERWGDLVEVSSWMQPLDEVEDG